MMSKRFNRYLSLILALATALSLTMHIQAGTGAVTVNEEVGIAGGMTPGAYTAEFRGYMGNVKVETLVDDSKILSVKVVENKETVGIGSFAVEMLPGTIVDAQSVGVDTISGATVTSRAILAAVTNALNQAGANMAKFEAAPPKPAPVNEELTTDVIVVGAGGAGLSAAIQARNNGRDALIIEKMDIPGGNTVLSSGSYNVAGSKEQLEAQKGRHSVEDFIQFTMTGGHDMNDPELVRFMITNSAAVVDWLAEQGVPSKIGETYQSYTPQGAAKGLILGLVERFEGLGGKIRYGVRATDIIMENGVATGVIATSKNGGKVTIRAKAVVIASGGFGGDLEMCARLDPSLEGFITNNSKGATGDGIKMAEAVGAATVHMEEIQIHPTVHQASSTMLTESIRNSGGILLNNSGKRFTNEVTYRDVVSAAIMAQDQGAAFLVYNQDLMNGNVNVQGYYEQGLVQRYDTVADLAAYMKVDTAVVQETLDTWNDYVANKNDPEFNSSFTWIRNLSEGPYYALWVAPGIHHTMGGIKINVDTEVISTSGDKIPGLFACGEVTGGIHGGNRVGGNAILDILVYGRVAGDSSAKYIK